MQLVAKNSWADVNAKSRTPIENSRNCLIRFRNFDFLPPRSIEIYLSVKFQLSNFIMLEDQLAESFAKEADFGRFSKIVEIDLKSTRTEAETTSNRIFDFAYPSAAIDGPIWKKKVCRKSGPAHLSICSTSSLGRWPGWQSTAQLRFLSGPKHRISHPDRKFS